MGPTGAGWDKQGCRGLGSRQVAERQISKSWVKFPMGPRGSAILPRHYREAEKLLPRLARAARGLLHRKFQKQSGLRAEK